MAKSIAQINKGTDFFDTMIDRVNELANTATNEALTANTNANGAYVTGNSYLFGIFGANTLAVHTALRGGNVQTGNTLVIVSNVSSNSQISVGNSTVNVVVGNAFVTVANLTQNVQIGFGSLSISGNLTIDASTFRVGNSTINAIANSSLVQVASGSGTANLHATSLVIGISTVNSTAVAVGANLVLNTTALAIGNVVSNTTTLKIGANVSLDSTSLLIGNSTVNAVINSVSIALGGNLVANQTSIVLGNSTANVFINSSSISVGGSPTITSATRDSVAYQGTLIGTRSRINFIQGDNVLLDLSDDDGNGQVNVTIASIATTGSQIIGGSNSAVQFNDGNNFNGNSSTFSFNKITQTMAVSNAAISNVLTIKSVGYVTGNSVSSVSSLGPDTIDSFDITAIRTVDYVYSIKDDAANGYQCGKLMILNDGTDGHLEEYAVGKSNAYLGSFSTSANATHISLIFTPTNSLSYTCKFVKTGVPV